MTSLPLELCQPPKASDDKYSRGVVGFITGSTLYPGAAVLGVKAAQAIGIGMIRYLGPDSVWQLVIAAAPEVVKVNGKAHAWVFGSGVSTAESSQLEHFKSLNTKNLVIDAGGLDFADIPALHSSIITPHAGEAVMLFKRFGHTIARSEIEADPLAHAIKLHELTGATVLLKGHRVALADDTHSRVLDASPSELATAGTGDVLGGILGALLARKVALDSSRSLFEVCELGVFLQSSAASLAAAEGPVSAMDVVRKLREAVKVLVP